MYNQNAPRNEVSFLQLVIQDRLDEARELLRRGNVDVDQRDSLGHTPLFKAVLNRNLEMVTLLLDSDADPNLASNDGDEHRTALFMAVGDDRKKLDPEFHEISMNERAVNPEFLAIFGRKVQIVNKLLAKGANVNHLDKYDQTVLHRAVEYIDIPFADLLVRDTPIDINQQSVYGETTLEIATDNLTVRTTHEDYLNFLALLLQHGADPNIAVYEYGTTPLHHAILKNDVDAVKLLLNFGADANLRQGDGIAPIDTAMNLKRSECIDVIIAYQYAKRVGIFAPEYFASLSQELRLKIEVLVVLWGLEGDAENLVHRLPLEMLYFLMKQILIEVSSYNDNE